MRRVEFEEKLEREREARTKAEEKLAELMNTVKIEDEKEFEDPGDNRSLPSELLVGGLSHRTVETTLV